jgi:hypothetical protein
MLKNLLGKLENRILGALFTPFTIFEEKHFENLKVKNVINLSVF